MSRQHTIGLSSSSVYPESTAVAFELATDLGYDGVEVMVGTDAMSQDLATLKGLVDHYQVPVLSIHAPCLLITQRVWGTDPWGKLDKALPPFGGNANMRDLSKTELLEWKK